MTQPDPIALSPAAQPDPRSVSLTESQTQNLLETIWIWSAFGIKNRKSNAFPAVFFN
jgi:hypothetical protein